MTATLTLPLMSFWKEEGSQFIISFQNSMRNEIDQLNTNVEVHSVDINSLNVDLCLDPNIVMSRMSWMLSDLIITWNLL